MASINSKKQIFYPLQTTITLPIFEVKTKANQFWKACTVYFSL